MARARREAGPGKAKLETLLRELEPMRVKVGFLETAKYDNGTPVAYVATIQENGVPERNIPPRPFMGPTAERCRTKWRETMKSLAAGLADGKTSLRGAMEFLGADAVEDIVESIIAVTSPALAPKTVKARMRKMAKEEDGDHRGLRVVRYEDKPLQETDVMLESVQYAVEEGGGA
ncbi:MAG: hypothetical protein LBB66_10415 [Desulfovibrio sp.]|jgi:hypothetical protein|nr:hypothetical protein [Desulfovibrio sp.]